MKKLTAVLLAIILGLSFCVGATAEKLVKVGWVICLDEELDEEERYAEEHYPDNNIQVPDGYELTVTEYETINELMTAYISGRIDVLNASLDTIRYILVRHPEFSDNLILEEPYDVFFVMALPQGKEDLQKRLNEGIQAMIDDGTRDALVDKWITNIGSISEPEATDMPKFDGAEVLRIGVTGDILPMDYMSIAGTPAGFNTDFMAYLANYLKVNIELVSLTSGARMIAMGTGRVDATFWFMDFILGESDTLLTTIPYHKSRLANLCSADLTDAILANYSEDQIAE